jgi:hypothetical protein
MSKPIDLEGVLLNTEQINRLQAQKQRKAWRREYVRVPWKWVERLQTTRRVNTYRLALLLLYEHWRTGGQPIALSNVGLVAEGINRRSKWNALTELERLELVQVDRRNGRSPRATLCHLAENRT